MDTKISEQEFARAATELGISSSDWDAYRPLVEANMEVAALVESVAVPAQEYGERAWRVPTPEDNPLGAWYLHTDIRGTGNGSLSGRTIALKDTVLLAGVPVNGGTTILDGYIPDRDAEIVTRLLQSGARITGKAVCEAYCFSGGSHTSATGPVHNPHHPQHTSGGSSSGSAALVANGDVDMAIGCDQGGSIRVPASYCGIVGMKPTYGLVPYTGILGMNPNIDHTGPMTQNVADNALLLDVLAGADGVDSRQHNPRVSRYSEALGRDVSGLRVGLVTEGFSMGGDDPLVGSAVREAARSLASLGAVVEEVSVPVHAIAGGVGFAGMQSMLTSMFQHDGCLLERPDVVPRGYLAHQRQWRERIDELPDHLRISLLSSQILGNRYGYEYVSRAQEALPVVRAGYDAALSSYDALVMPTTPTTAPLIPAADASVAENMAAALGPLVNTIAFNNTHHPALSVPCGTIDGLPVGMMLVGRHWEESTLYSLAHALEQSLG
ncbi:amidase [Pseudohalioglobus sediminis]|uniref:Amidase n=1 Tax=Pseudohalioglobus sediminis TaxID=2606449 RepID=A0A5B0X3X8_9GAMM|nr:amidase [Pseudohalioglobus sediminis]KAA1194006.1 amidase [Pseudohalioglobus sediminis]